MILDEDGNHIDVCIHSIEDNYTKG